MKIISGKHNLYLEETTIENLFIGEYMIPAEGYCIKVFLLGKMYLESGQNVSNEDLGRYLGIPLSQVLEAWDYWESKGVVRKHINGADPADFDLEFVGLRDLMVGSSSDKKAPEAEKEEAAEKINSSLYSPALIDLFSSVEQKVSRTLNSREIRDLTYWHNDMGMAPEVILKAYDLCINERKKKPDRAYIESIIKDWYGKGLSTKEKLEDYLISHDKRHNIYKRIFQALGFIGRYPTEEERRIMDTWFDEYMLDISAVLEACKKTSGISNPSINYINSVIKNWQSEGKITPGGKTAPTLSQINKYYTEIRSVNKKTEEARQNEVYTKIPRIREIENELLDLNPKRLHLLLSGQKKSQTYLSMEEEMKNLRKEKIHLLEKGGYAADYLSPIYTCPVCKDTGFLENGEKCICLTKKLMEK